MYPIFWGTLSERDPILALKASWDPMPYNEKRKFSETGPSTSGGDWRLGYPVAVQSTGGAGILTSFPFSPFALSNHPGIRPPGTPVLLT